jgi:ATP-binding cassette, subfamily B, bacterial PglK
LKAWGQRQNIDSPRVYGIVCVISLTMRSLFKGKFETLEKAVSLFDRKEKLQFAGVLAAALAAALFQALGVVSILPFVELVMTPEAVYENRVFAFLFTSFGFESVFSFTMAVGFVMLAILVVGNLVSAFSEWLKIRFVWQKGHRISVALLHRYLSLPYVYFLHAHSAELSKNIVFEVQQFTLRFLMPILQIVTRGIVALVIIALLFLVHPGIALGAALIFVCAYVIIFLFLRSTLRARGEERLLENTGRFTAAGEALSGIKDIKALGREGYFLERFSRHSVRFSGLQAWTGVATQLPRYFMEIVAFGGVVALILVLLNLRQEGSQIIPLIGFFAFAGYRLMPALQSAFQSASDIQFHRATLDKLLEDMQGEVEQFVLSSDAKLPDPLAFKDRIELKNVSFLYPYSEEPVLQDVNIEIPKGTVVGLAGPTGGGKTTLVDILIGLLLPSRGSLNVDGVVVEQKNVRNWQRNLGYVPQQIFLADDTITHNIAFGLPDDKIDAARIEQVCKIAKLHDFITEELPQGYGTMVGERGIRLSGGQRQRIGIARALYHDPEMLVLDEATSSLDGVTEKAVLEAVGDIAKFKTIVMVAHRISTMRNCDVVYIIDKGRIAAHGSYANLLEGNAQFRAMAQESEHA